MSNKSLAHYELVEKIGEGGMGEVFRARDTKLGRDVALKFLPDALGADAERLGRFEREARLLAALNHPHIASIYGFEQIEGQRFLVLELAQGEDLSKRLARGAVPVDETLPICRQLAEALEAAHDEGIVHRDLKPGNIAVDTNGSVKVLDFGLAKAWESDTPGARSDISHSPTILTNSPTVAGVILGTAAYMSPEQARGRTVDRRADIFAFGCVMFEMLTGRQLFAGETVSDTLAAVLRAEPDFAALPDETPRAIVKLLRRCLDKDPKQRLRDIGEARIVIERVLRGEDDPDPAAATAPAPETPTGRSRARVAWAAAAFFALVAVLVSVAFFTRPSVEGRVLRASLMPPDDVRFNLRGVHPGPVVMSPDGKRIVFSGRGPGAAALLYVRDLDATEARALNGTDEAGYPFWSPDGRSIGFFSEGKLRRVEVSGGPPLTLCDAPFGKGGTWSDDGVIVLAPSFNSGLSRVNQAGGPATPVTQLDVGRSDNSHRFPFFLPDGDRFLYFARSTGESSALRVGSLSGKIDKLIMPSTSNAVYASGYLLFLREATLMARPFDLGALEFTGDPVPVGDPVRYIPGAMCGIFSASDNGMLMYQGGASVPGAHLVWRDFEGNKVDQIDDIVQQDNVAVSPDGQRIAAEVFDNASGTADVWIYDVPRRIRTRFTFDPTNDQSPVWSPDGDRIVFSSNRDGISKLFVKRVGGATNEELLLDTGHEVYATDWTQDGRYIVFLQVDSTAGGDIWVMPQFEDRTPSPLIASNFGEYGARVSPNGKWVVYQSDESGRFEVYVTSFPVTGRKWQVSSGGGFGAHWRRDGKGILYGSGNALYLVDTETEGDTFGIGQSRALFESNNALAYDTDADNERLVIFEDADEGDVNPLTLVVNWLTDLERRQR